MPIQNNKYWQPPHISKTYEAITAIADKRIEFDSNTHSAKIYSSSGNKFYTVNFDPANMAIMANDNSAYFTDKISYTMIAVLILEKIITYDKKLLKPLKNIFWKKINKKHKNNYEKAIIEVLEEKEKKGFNTEEIHNSIKQIHQQILSLKLVKLGKKQFPPRGF